MARVPQALKPQRSTCFGKAGLRHPETTSRLAVKKLCLLLKQHWSLEFKLWVPESLGGFGPSLGFLCEECFAFEGPVGWGTIVRTSRCRRCVLQASAPSSRNPSRIVGILPAHQQLHMLWPGCLLCPGRQRQRLLTAGAEGLHGSLRLGVSSTWQVILSPKANGH